MRKYIFYFLSLIIIISSLGMTLDLRASTQSITGPVTLQDFQITSRDSGWIILGNNLFWTSTGGKTWENISPALDQTLRSVEFLDATTGFAITSKINSDQTIGYQLYYTNNQGVTWTSRKIISYPLTSPDAFVSSINISFLNPNQGWLVFQRLTSSNFSIGTLFRTSDGGNSWQNLPLPVAGELEFIDTQNGYLVGGTQNQVLYRTADSGNTWERYDSSQNVMSNATLPNFIAHELGEFISFQKRNNGTVLNVLGTTDSGLKWENKTEVVISENEWIYAPVSSIPGEIKIITPNQVITYWQTSEMFEVEDRTTRDNISKFDMIDNNYGWAVSYQMDCVESGDTQSCTPSQNFLKTQNGGISWSMVETPIMLTVFEPDQSSQSITPSQVLSLSRTDWHTGQGFDQCEIFPLSDLQKWKTNSPYSVVNLYIGGKARACDNVNLSPEFISALSIQGWKFIPTWVGPQAACTTFSVTMSPNSSTAYGQGKDQAIDAARTARKYGLSFSDTDESGTVIYYDLEAFNINDTQCLNAAKAFINGWVEELHSRGIMAGLYGSVCGSGLNEYYGLDNVPDVIWPAFWISSTYVSSTTVNNLPCVSNSMWGNHQRILQYTGPHIENWGGTTMNIDLNVIDGIVADISGKVGVPTSTLSNTSFEDGALAPWEIEQTDTDCNWQVVNSPTNSRTGDNFLSINKTGIQTSCLGASQSLSFTPVVGETYRFAVWARSSSPLTYRSLRLQITGTGITTESTSQKFSGIGEDWMCLEVAHTIAQNNLSGIKVLLQPEDSDGVDLYLDDAHLSLNTGPICAQMMPPSGVVATDGAASDAVNIQWDEVPAATYYKVYRSFDLVSQKAQIGTVFDTQYTDQDGYYYDAFYYWIKACNANSCSIFSPAERGEFASPFLDFFVDFESGNLSKWIGQQNLTKFDVCNTNPITGQYSLCINSNIQTSAFLVHKLPVETNSIHTSFTIDPNTANIGSREYVILEANDTAIDKIAFQLKLSLAASGYRIKLEGQDNSGLTHSTKWFSIPDSPATIEVYWNSTIGQFRSGDTFSGFSLLINGNLKGNLIGILNNQIKIDQLNFGAQVTDSNLGTSGEFYLDDFSLAGPAFLQQK